MIIFINELSNLDHSLRWVGGGLLFLIFMHGLIGYKKGPAYLALSLLALSTMGYLFFPLVWRSAPESGWRWLLVILANGIPFFFWASTALIFDHSFILKPWHGVLGLFFLCSTPLALYADSGQKGGFMWAMLYAQAFALVYVGLALWHVAKDWGSDLVERRYRVRKFVFFILAGHILAVILITILLQGSWPENPLKSFNTLIITLDALMITIYALIINLLVLNLDLSRIMGGAPPVANLKQKEQLTHILTLMSHHEFHQEVNLTIGDLATKLQIPEYQLRRLINQDREAEYH